MYYELYIDLFFLENFMMDSILLLLADHILKNGRPYGRIVLGGALGSLLTCLVIVSPFPSVIRLILFHAAVSSIMLLVSLRITGVSQFMKAYILLYISAVLLGGIMQIFRPYMRYVSLFYAAASVSYILALKLWNIISRIHIFRSTILEMTLYTDKGEKTIRALLDTGNELYDCVTGDPVSIIDPGIAHEITNHPEAEKGFRYIPYRCIQGEAVMKVFRIRRMCVRADEERWIENPLLGIGENRLSCEGEYEMILNPAVFTVYTGRS